MDVGLRELAVLLGCATAVIVWLCSMAALSLKTLSFWIRESTILYQRRRALSVEQGLHIDLAEHFYRVYTENNGFAKQYRQLAADDQKGWQRVAAAAVALDERDSYGVAAE